MKRLLAIGLVGTMVGMVRPGLAAEPQGLRIYFIDVEGGAATLIVTPAGEAVLIDSGWPGHKDRDPKRILHAAGLAGVRQIDHYIQTHWHVDHYGGIGALARMMPVKHFWDHGIPDRVPEDPTHFPSLIAAYQEASGGRSKVIHPGDRIPLHRAEGTPPIELTCVCANRKVIGESDPSGRPNPLCAQDRPMAEDPTENAASVGVLLRYGGFRFLDCGDLTWQMEARLVCPTNRIGTVDLYQVDHHGMAISNNPTFVRSIRPTVAVMDNGARKAGEPGAVKAVRSVPGLEAFYALHRNVTTRPDQNADPDLIANPDERCQGVFIEARVSPDGRSFTVEIGEHGAPRSFKTRSHKSAAARSPGSQGA